MPELMHSLFDYFDPLMDQFRSNARRHYGARGIFIPSRTSLSGYDVTYNDQYCMTFWTAGAAWYAGFYYDYCLYTGDKDFLRNKALPLMKEAALFYEDFLVKDARGVYQFNPSYSPENTPGGGNSQAAPQRHHGPRRLPAIAAEPDRGLHGVGHRKGKRGQVEGDAGRASSLHDRRQGRTQGMVRADPEGQPEPPPQFAFPRPVVRGRPGHRRRPGLAGRGEEGRAALRAEYRKHSPGVMGFGEVQIGLAAAALEDAQTAWSCLDRLATRYYYPTFASAHNAGPNTFNADISGGLPAVIVETLVQSQPGNVKLLPALPRELPAGRITGVPCRGQVTVEELRWSPGRVDFTLRSAKDQEVTVECRHNDRLFRARPNLKANVPIVQRWPAE